MAQRSGGESNDKQIRSGSSEGEMIGKGQGLKTQTIDVGSSLTIFNRERESLIESQCILTFLV